MANKHESLKWEIIAHWSASGRGRLYCMNQALAYPVRKDENGNTIPADFPLWFGPLKESFSGFPDTFGFEFVDGIPVYCVVEIKTLAYSTVSAEQKVYLNYAASIGARAYVGREVKGGGFEIERWAG